MTRPEYRAPVEGNCGWDEGCLIGATCRWKCRRNGMSWKIAITVGEPNNRPDYCPGCGEKPSKQPRPTEVRDA